MQSHIFVPSITQEGGSDISFVMQETMSGGEILLVLRMNIFD
jgi:hypothetical protein